MSHFQLSSVGLFGVDFEVRRETALKIATDLPGYSSHDP